jgi:hypothetical protein
MGLLAAFLSVVAVGGAVAWFIWRKPLLSVAAMIERILVVGFFVFSAIGCFAAGNTRGGWIATALAAALNGIYMIAFHRAQKKSRVAG